MIPAIGGGLTNSGSMPVDAGGGDSGDATATNQASFGGITQGAVNFGGTGITDKIPLIIVASALLYLVIKR